MINGIGENERGLPEQARDYCQWEYYPGDNKHWFYNPKANTPLGEKRFADYVVDGKGIRKRDEGTVFVEWGTFGKGRGERTDLEAFTTEIRAGRTKDQLLDMFPGLMAQYFRFYEWMKSEEGADRKEMPKLIISLGRGETGKSSSAYMEFPGFYKKTGNSQWWPRYDGQPTVVWNEFSPAKCPRDEMFDMVDYGVYSVPIKGGFRPLKATTFVLTTNRPLQEVMGWYTSDTAEDWAWWRRIWEIRDYGNKRHRWEEGKAAEYKVVWANPNNPKAFALIGKLKSVELVRYISEKHGQAAPVHVDVSVERSAEAAEEKKVDDGWVEPSV